MQDLKISLTIEGSPSVIAAVIAAVSSIQGNAVSTPTGITIPVAPTSPPLPSSEGAAIPHAPSPPMMPPETTGSDDGEASDGSGVDSTGLPWDERIHSTPATKTKAGTWRARRGNTPELVAQVEAELRGGVQTVAPPLAAPAMPEAGVQPPMPPVNPPEAGVPQAMPTPAPTPPTMPIPMPNPPAPVAEQPPVAVPPPIPVAPPASIPAAPVADNGDFEGFMAHVMGNMHKINPADSKPLIHADYLEQIVIETSAAWNVPLQSITDVKSHPEMIPWVTAAIQRDGRW